MDLQEYDATWGVVPIVRVEEENTMGGLSRRRIGAVAVTGLVVAGVAAFSSISASGQTPALASGPVLIPYGTLTINLNSTPESFELRNPSGGIMRTENIESVQPCATVIEGSGDLLNLSPTRPGLDTVQIRNAAFGVNTGNTSCGSSAAAVISGSEKLTVDLGPNLAGVYAKSASLQITQVKRGNLKVALDGDPFLTNENISTSPQQVSVNPTINAAGDLFTSIALESTSNKDNEGISLAHGTTFELVTLDPDFDVAVDCGEFVPAPPALPGSVATSATYQRLDNKLGTNACQEVGVRVEIQPAIPGVRESRVFWNNDFVGVNGGSIQNVQAYFTIVWAPTPTNESASLNRVIDYTGTATQGTPMLWCGPTQNGVPTLPPYTGAGAIEWSPTVEGDDLRAPWCLVNDDRALQADGTIVQTQQLFGSGDPWAR